MGRVLLNPRSDSAVWPCPGRDPLGFHRALPGYEPTPLVELPALAEVLGLARLLVKDESRRYGLPAFKVLGASWAVARELDAGAAARGDLAQLRAEAARRGVGRLVTATDGNHGRGVARVAAWLGLDARVLVPSGTAPARLAAIAGEGASVEEVAGDYDAAVARAAREADEGGLLVQDTSFPGYERIPRRVVEGYGTILWELEEQLAGMELPFPDLLPVPVGVGSLAAAVARHVRSRIDGERPRLVAVEPTGAACALASIEAGEPRSVHGPHSSILAGLNCGTLATLAWPLLRDGFDAFVAVDDERARDAVRILHRAGVVAGESGAASLAGLLELLRESGEARARLGIGGACTALVLVTEGPTDPDAWKAIVLGDENDASR